MQRQGSADEFLAKWSLAPEDMMLLDGPIGPGRLGLAVQLAFWRQHSRFPDDDADVPPVVIAHLASQVGPDPTVILVANSMFEECSGSGHPRIKSDGTIQAALGAAPTGDRWQGGEFGCRPDVILIRAGAYTRNDDSRQSQS